MTREEWLKTLKEGSLVLVDDQPSMQVIQVKKITPTGKIRLINNALLNEDGRGSSGQQFHKTYYNIQPITPEIEVEILARTKMKRERRESERILEHITNTYKKLINNSTTENIGYILEDLQEMQKRIK